MTIQYDILRAVAGLGLFLFGMYQLESGLAKLAGRSFKQFLRQHTRNPLESILTGTLTTALLQSSSVIMLMTLAFVGAGILEFRNAIGIVLGANLGTTLTGWVVATFGFKLDFETYAFFIAGFGALLGFFATERSKLRYLGAFISGFGFLFLGLGAMKSGAEHLAAGFDFTHFTNFPPIVFLFVGVIITAIINSSSATMVLTLSSLSAGVINLDMATAVVIGADLGTTSTAILGSLKGSAPKRRVAAAHVSFNFATCVLAFALRIPIMNLLETFTSDPLFALVAFHSSFNLLAIVIFLPILGVYTRWLESLFHTAEVSYSGYIAKVPAAVPEAAIEAVASESRDLFGQVLNLNLIAFGAELLIPERPGAAVVRGRPYLNAYQAIKQSEGEILSYATNIQQQALEDHERRDLAKHLRSVRESAHAAKCIKDIIGDIEQFAEEDDDRTLQDQLEKLRVSFVTYIGDLLSIVQDEDEEQRYRRIVSMFERCQKEYDAFAKAMAGGTARNHRESVRISTKLNVNREVYSAKKSMLLAARDAYLNAQQAEDVVNVPLNYWP